MTNTPPALQRLGRFSLTVAFIGVPFWVLAGEAGWWSLLVVPACLHQYSCGVLDGRKLERGEW